MCHVSQPCGRRPVRCRLIRRGASGASPWCTVHMQAPLPRRRPRSAWRSAPRATTNEVECHRRALHARTLSPSSRGSAGSLPGVGTGQRTVRANDRRRLLLPAHGHRTPACSSEMTTFTAPAAPPREPHRRNRRRHRADRVALPSPPRPSCRHPTPAWWPPGAPHSAGEVPTRPVDVPASRPLRHRYSLRTTARHRWATGASQTPSARLPAGVVAIDADSTGRCPNADGRLALGVPAPHRPVTGITQSAAFRRGGWP